MHNEHHSQAVSDIQETHNDARVLVLGSGMGIIPLLALKAGAVHVTVIERCVFDLSKHSSVIICFLAQFGTAESEGMQVNFLLAPAHCLILTTLQCRRWLYVASACKDLLLHNNVDPASFTIIHARATDVLMPSKQLPVPCNLLIANGILDEGE